MTTTHPRRPPRGLWPLLAFASFLALAGALTAAEKLRGRPAVPFQADLILVNAKIWTGAGPDAEALAVWQGRVVAVGAKADVARHAGPATKTLDAAGRRVVPGFHDSHAHMLGGGMSLARVNLKDAADEAEFGRRLQEFDKKLPADRWLLGGNWDHDRTFGGTLPTAALVDKYVKDRPVFLRRYDGHMALANTKALQIAAITAATPDPSGGVIVRLPNSKEPSGVLRDNAMGLITGKGLVPAGSDAEVAEALKAALNEARQHGVTSVEDMDGNDAAARRTLLRMYQDLARRGELTTRVSLRWPLAEWRSLANLGVQAGYGDEWVRIGGLKGFADGSLGASTAKFFQPYLHEPGNTGVYVTPPGRMQELVTGADAAGLSVCVHAIGDQANATMLDIFGEAAKANGPRDRRFRIEHAQHLRAEDYARFKNLNVVASMQPYHIIDDGRWAEGRVGKERCAASYAYRSLTDVGAHVALGSDWPVAPLSPLLGIDAAVNRRTLDGKHPGGWHPHQKITVAEALRGYTYESAYAAGAEREKGTLEPGKLADFVILSRDILDPAERDNITETKVMTTVVGGKVVYEGR
jgi:predicted amidohydrolase YtcJ